MSISLTPHGIHTPEEICKCKTEAQKGIQYTDKHCPCSPRLHKLWYRCRASRRGWQAKHALVLLAFVWLISCPAFLWGKKRSVLEVLGIVLKIRNLMHVGLTSGCCCSPTFHVPFKKRSLERSNRLQGKWITFSFLMLTGVAFILQN